MASVPYASGIRSLIYDMVYRKHDLAYDVSVISMFMSNPGRSH